MNRPEVGEAEIYHGRRLSAQFAGPDLLAFCDDMELAHFYLDVEAAHTAGRRHVDAEMKAEREAKAKQ